MFTGIIETIGTIRQIEKDGGNSHFTIESEISRELKIDQSVAHDGVCLTVVELGDNAYRVTAIKESLEVTRLGEWKVGGTVNLERCMPATGRFDGHIVQGHVDTTALVTKIENDNGSWRFYFSHQLNPGFVTVKKGSITINGVSLTVVDSSPDSFSVAIIPYTFEHTGFKNLQVGDSVNLEFDIVGKYVAEMLKRSK